MGIKQINPTVLALLLAAGAGLGAGEPLTVAGAIRTAWRDQAGLLAGQALVAGRRAEAEAARDLRLPTLAVQAQGFRTDEPMMAFGTRLNQARITAADFDPAALNRPRPIGAYGGAVVLQQPLYAGGRLDAARRAGEHLAQAEAANQARRQQEAALKVVEAYFGIQVAEQAQAWAEETLAWVRGAEAFTGARVAQGLMLEADLQRLKAVRAQAEAQHAEATRQVRTARSGLGLLLGTGLVEGPLGTPLEAPAAPAAVAGEAGLRADLVAADLEARAAREGAAAAEGRRRPELGLEVGAGTLRHAWSDGGRWTWAALGLKWNLFSAPDQARARAARAQAQAAAELRTFKQRQADHEVRVAEAALAAAEARQTAASASLAAAQEAKRLREARHREGLAPLVEVLDAEAALQGARTLLLQSRLDLRASRAALDLATGRPIEGVQP
jgi:outer membrane protein TolC